MRVSVALDVTFIDVPDRSSADRVRGTGRRAEPGHVMTTHKHFKQLVRARMTASGESYTAAREWVLAAQTDIRLADPVVVGVHGRHGQSVAFTPDGTQLLSGGQDARIAILDPATGTVTGELTGHEKVVTAVAVTPDGATVVSSSSDRTVRVWDLPSRSSRTILEGHRDAVTALDIAPEGALAMSAGYDGRLRIWDLHEAACLQEYRSRLKRTAAVVHTPDGTRFVEAGQGPTAYVRQVHDGETVAELDAAATGVIGAAVSPDGAMVATAGHDGTVVLWDTSTWARVRELRAGERANAVCFSRSGQLIAAAAKGRIIAWRHDHENPVAETDLPIAGVYALAFSPDTRRLAQAGADGKVRIWNLR